MENKNSGEAAGLGGGLAQQSWLSKAYHLSRSFITPRFTSEEIRQSGTTYSRSSGMLLRTEHEACRALAYLVLAIHYPSPVPSSELSRLPSYTVDLVNYAARTGRPLSRPCPGPDAQSLVPMMVDLIKRLDDTTNQANGHCSKLGYLGFQAELPWPVGRFLVANADPDSLCTVEYWARPDIKERITALVSEGLFLIEEVNILLGVTRRRPLACGNDSSMARARRRPGRGDPGRVIEGYAAVDV